MYQVSHFHVSVWQYTGIAPISLAHLIEVLEGKGKRSISARVAPQSISDALVTLLHLSLAVVIWTFVCPFLLAVITAPKVERVFNHVELHKCQLGCWIKSLLKIPWLIYVYGSDVYPCLYTIHIQAPTHAHALGHQACTRSAIFQLTRAYLNKRERNLLHVLVLWKTAFLHYSHGTGFRYRFCVNASLPWWHAHAGPSLRYKKWSGCR